LIPLFCMPVWRRFVDTLILQGKIPQKALDDPKVAVYAVQWTAPKFESVDPVKDAAAELKMIRTGTLDLFEAISRNGYDPEERLRKIAAVNKLLDKLEIILDCDPRNVTDRGQEQPAASGERTPSSKPVVGAPKGATGVSNEAGDAAAITELLAGVGASRSWDSPSRIYRS
jgi:capsid protein